MSPLHRFDDEFLPHADALANFAYYLTQNKNEVADLVQDTLFKAFKGADSYIEGTNARAWLFRIMKNTFINEYNQKKRRGKVVDYDSATLKTEHENPDYPLHADLDYELHNSELGDEILLAINSLSDEYRSIMLLCYVDEFKYEELADIYDIPIGTVRSRLARARSLLKVKLKSYASSHGFDTEATT